MLAHARAQKMVASISAAPPRHEQLAVNFGRKPKPDASSNIREQRRPAQHRPVHKPRQRRQLQIKRRALTRHETNEPQYDLANQVLQDQWLREDHLQR